MRFSLRLRLLVLVTRVSMISCAVHVDVAKSLPIRSITVYYRLGN
jgi:hypothetical protein